jgi:hypothetical protein
MPNEPAEKKKIDDKGTRDIGASAVWRATEVCKKCAAQEKNQVSGKSNP